MKNLEKKSNLPENRTSISLPKRSLILLTTLLIWFAMPVFAQAEPADDTELGFEVYMWMPTISSSTVTGDKVVITFGDILKNLDFTAMLRGTYQKNRFFGAADMIYFKVGKDQRHDGEFLGNPIEGKLEVGLEAWVLNFVGGYHLVDNNKTKLGLLGGARYLKLTLDTTVKLEDKKNKGSVGDSGWDGVVGFRGRHNYPDGHYFRYYADVGGGNSKLTWQAQAEFAYDYKKFTGIAGYRYLKWNFKNDAEAMDNMNVHGPYLGMKWTW